MPLSSVSGAINLADIDLSKMSIDAAMLFVQTAVIHNQTDDVEDYMKKVQASNVKLQKANVASDLVNNMINQFGNETNVSKCYSDVDGDATDRNNKLAGLDPIAGVASGGNPNLGALQKGLEAISNSKSSTNNTSQLDMVKLQSAMSAMSTSVATATSTIKSIADSKQGVARNM
jgi:hypothetical protein